MTKFWYFFLDCKCRLQYVNYFICSTCSTHKFYFDDTFPKLSWKLIWILKRAGLKAPDQSFTEWFYCKRVWQYFLPFTYICITKIRHLKRRSYIQKGLKLKFDYVSKIFRSPWHKSKYQHIKGSKYEHGILWKFWSRLKYHVKRKSCRPVKSWSNVLYSMLCELYFANICNGTNCFF
jgi:hypothetical protein